MRRIVCPCEDLTDSDILDAVKLGHAELEAVKRYTGVATGPCQGKQCIVACQKLLAEACGVSLEAVGTIVHRPPLAPVPLGLLAGEVEER
jgi:bacterioferritin-associated ferredoxin